MELKLPPSIVGYSDLKRIIRTLEDREEQFISASSKGQEAIAGPSEAALIDLANLNQINLNDRKVCQQLKIYLDEWSDKLPKLHLSFAVEPSEQVVHKMVAWLRQNIHPGALIGIGLQPSIAAGCILRTPNKIFDLSLRSFIDRQNEYLLELIQGAARGN